MSLNAESFLLKTPFRCFYPQRRVIITSAVTPSLRLEYPISKLFVSSRNEAFPKGFGLSFLPLRRQSQRFFAFAASDEEKSKYSDVEVEKEQEYIKTETSETEEAWKETLAAFKEQALKMQCLSQEAYEVYSKKAMILLKETSEQLKIQAEKAREDLAVIAKEISEGSKEYLSTAAESSPEVKEIVETFASPEEDLKDVSQVRDFYLGIPYGLLLSVGGFLSFMITGSISAIRFGIILGGTLLALSISSLRAHKRGESFPLALKGQAVIAGILFLREISLLIQRASLFGGLMTIFSGAMLAFYLYKIKQNGETRRDSSYEPGTEAS